MKPISEWTDAELEWAGPEHSEDLAAEVVRLRTYYDAETAACREYLARAEKAEAEAARVKAHNGECGTCDGWHTCCESLGQALEDTEVLESRAEAAEAALADARDTVVYERRANEDNCAKLLEAEAELAAARSEIEDLRNECHHVDALGQAEAELARCRPVIEAALEYRDGVRGDYCYIPFLAVAVDAYRDGGIV